MRLHTKAPCGNSLLFLLLICWLLPGGPFSLFAGAAAQAGGPAAGQQAMGAGNSTVPDAAGQAPAAGDAGRDYRGSVPLTPAERQWLAAHPVITLAVDEGYPPKNFRNSAGEIDGISIDFIRLLAGKLGITIRFAGSTWSEALQQAMAHQVDGIVNVEMLEQRYSSLNFTDACIVYPLALVTRQGEQSIRSPADFGGRRIAVKKASDKLTILEQHYPRVVAVQVDTLSEAVNLLIAKKVDGVFDDATVLYHHIVENFLPNLKFAYIQTVEQVGHSRIGLRSDAPELLAIFNKAIVSITEAERRQIQRKWLDIDLHQGRIFQIERQPAFTAAEFAWLKAHPVIRVASDPAWAPMEFVDEHGEYQGFAIDYLKRLSDLLGISFEIEKGKTWQELVAMVKKRELDMFSCLTLTPERKAYVNFTRPYLSFPIVIFTRKDMSYVGKLDDLAGRKVAVVESYAIHDLLKTHHPELDIVPVRTVNDGLRMLDNSEVAAFIENLLTGSNYISQQGLANIKVGGETPYKNEMSLAVRGDWPEFVPILQKALDAVSEEDKAGLYRKWVLFTYSEGRVDYALLFKVLAGGVVLFAAFLYWNRRLAREVDTRRKAEEQLRLHQEELKNIVAAKTRDLTEANQRLQEEIEDRRKAYEELRMVEARNSLILRSLPMAFYIASPSDTYGGVWLSGQIEKISGFPAERFTDDLDFWQARLHPEDRARVFRVFDSIHQQKLIMVEYRWLHADGSYRWFEDNAILVSDDRGEPREIVGTWLDISESKVAEEERLRLAEQLQQAQKMESIGTLAGGIAHDFNNILSAIIGYAELVKQRLTQDSEIWIFQQRVIGAGMRARDLVQQILAFSRQTPQEYKPLKIHIFVKEALKLLRSTIPTTIEIRQSINPACGTIMANPTQIHQIMFNLCTNAYHAMRETGGVLAVGLDEVEVRADDYLAGLRLNPGRYVRLDVSDTGPGIRPEIRNRIFEPYFTTKDKGEGTGMGLAVVHGIVQSHHGHISVYSEPGAGTTFHVYLPRVAMDSGAAETENEGSVPMGHERILVVDDEEEIIRISRQILEGLGYTVTAFTGSIEAWRTFSSNPRDYDLVITDMTMPDMTGTDLALKILRLRPDMPIVLCTGFSELISEEKAKSLGIRAYITKPVLRNDFALVVRRTLDEGWSA
ncbi:MAG: transporter substrate-binding domain-containing protein [Thermodesulfobacteriota bacterium]